MITKNTSQIARTAAAMAKTTRCLTVGGRRRKDSGRTGALRLSAPLSGDESGGTAFVAEGLRGAKLAGV